MKRAFGILGMTVVLLLMAVAVLVFMAPRFGWKLSTVISGSMEPSFKVGGVVITRPVVTGAVKIGDVISFISPLTKELTSHRVVAIETGSSLHFRTKGDANEDPDPFIVTASSVTGKVFYYVPYFGYITQFVKTRLGMLMTICLPGLIIIILEIRKIWNTLTVERSEGDVR